MTDGASNGEGMKFHRLEAPTRLYEKHFGARETKITKLAVIPYDPYKVVSTTPTTVVSLVNDEVERVF